MLNIVVDHYPIKKSPLVGLIYPDNSVQQIPGVWEGIKLDAAGMSVSLNDIEHKILRREFKEPSNSFCDCLCIDRLPTIEE